MIHGSIRLGLVLVLLAGAPGAMAAPDHGQWQSLLEEYVEEVDGGQATRVDYGGLMNDRARLQGYLDELAAVPREQFEAWPQNTQLAFLINAYNAWTVESILREYPAIDSIRDIGFLPGAAWRRKVVSLFGEQVSLDNVEHDMIRGWDRFQEPRIHFAVNCAAIGCPPLRAEAYTGERLQQQLDDNTRLFLSDRERNYIEGDTAYISRIFDWYEGDFQQGWIGIESVSEFLLRYTDALKIDADTAARMARDEIRLRYLDYDWGLNAARE